ncbi:lipoprotein-releasing ABC transporter permease subunit [Histophilus somni]|uniref:Lipoprotein-releasing ABC transporter permease subunit n=1 Tax=Histophilus somni TaxID=731 RepID=A0AAX2S3K3_HISSO|nr:lipoprotein-releasing ABC transporter permease subunit [Histophilus somni]QEH08902.1 lipoprotein-releasing ABC transporter permease subunit [Histophilus somni]QEH12516.1 lipoprotein-releasing ABC transporter permease subunit [Histophilus somni]QEH25174.1 lipoprotein-releasing ABC transporter permease subunit [Histophilus somni]QEH26998.1 lipoprotein-releasing ABC transporter permease subunit [Histophilus somni]QEH51192.1 lipoprotein-releasing ABC transporter permease subunit [Histophilus so
MTFPISLFIALRYWRAKSADHFGQLVTTLATVGIILGVMALIIVLSVMNGLEKYQKQQVLSNIPHSILMPKNNSIYLTDSQPDMPDFVQKVVPINTTSAVFQTAQGVSAGQILGVQKFSDDPLLSEFSENHFSQLLSIGEFKLIIGWKLAQKLNVQIGDKVRVMVTENSQYTPFGRVPVQRLFTISDIYSSFSEQASYAVFANLADIGRLMRIKPEQVQGYRLFLQDPFFISELPKFFPTEQWKIVDWRSQKGEFFQAVRMEKNMMSLLISLIIVVAVSNIVTSLSLMVVDKQGEIAILQTQGLRKGQVRNIFILQGFFVGASGAVLGGGLGVVVAMNLAKIIQWINPQGIFLPTEINVYQIALILFFSLTLSLISTIYPAYRASKIEPAQALRYE